MRDFYEYKNIVMPFEGTRHEADNYDVTLSTRYMATTQF